MHPDQNPDKIDKWIEFEIAYNIIKKLSDLGLSFDQYSETLENTPGGKKKDSVNSKAKTNKSSRSNESRNSHQNQSHKTSTASMRGADISIRVKASFDQIVYGCSLRVKIPTSSAGKNANNDLLVIIVTPTPIWTNKDGSISQRSLNAVFNKKVTVNGYGENEIYGGIPGNLIIRFEIDTSRSEAIRDVISNHFRTGHQDFYFGQTTVDSEPPHEDAKTHQKPKSTSTKSKVVKSVVVALIVSLLVNYVSGNVDKRNSWDATFTICSSADSINSDILLNKFYKYENPYRAAIYYDYFSKDIDAVDYVASINEESMRIQHSDYLGIRTFAQNLVSAIGRDDISIVGAMNSLKIECARKNEFWSE